MTKVQSLRKAYNWFVYEYGDFDYLITFTTLPGKDLLTSTQYGLPLSSLIKFIRGASLPCKWISR